MPAAPNEETALLASSQKSSKSQKSKWWPSFLWTRYGKSEEPETNLPADDAHATERDASKQHPDDDLTKKPTILASVIVLYFGVWIATADTTLVTAVYNIISSDLSEFQDAMWILAAYQLGMAPAQPLYGKLSDIFGHKAMLTGAYLLFALGCLLCGTGNSLLHFSAGRVIAGAGGAGMRSLVSSLIVHFVPLRDVAVWRSWMYVVVTFGRSTGAPLGGVLTDTIGWRNAFIFQAPLVFVALILVWRRIPSEFEHKPVEADENASMGSLQTTLSKIRRIDFLGAFLLATSIVSFVLVFNLASKDLTFSDPWVISLIVLFFVSSFLFLFVEARVSSEPIFPLRLLLERDVLTAYLIIGFVLIGNICVSVPFCNPYELVIHLVPNSLILVDGFFCATILLRRATSFQHRRLSSSNSIHRWEYIWIYSHRLADQTVRPYRVLVSSINALYFPPHRCQILAIFQSIFPYSLPS